MTEEHDAGGDGELLVSWERWLAPWVTYEVVVDGRAMSRLGYRRPALIPLTTGPHEVILRHRKFHSRPVPINVASGGRVALFGAVRTMPASANPWENLRWLKENSTWLGTEPTPPKPVQSFSAARMLLALGGVILFAFNAAAALDRGQSFWLVLAVLFVVASLTSVIREVRLLWRSKRWASR